MMSSDLFFRDKIPVVVLGATRKAGSKLVQKLTSHPWFQIAALCEDSRHGCGQPYGRIMSDLSFLPDFIQKMVLQSCDHPLSYPVVFSSLSTADQWQEKLWAEAGAYVISLRSPSILCDLPLIVPGVNEDQFLLISNRHKKGGILAIPTPLVCGLSLVLKPLFDRFGLDVVHIQVPFSIDSDDQKTEIAEQILLVLSTSQKHEAPNRNLVDRPHFDSVKACQGSDLTLKDQLDSTLKKTFELILTRDLTESSLSIAMRLKKEAEMQELIQTWHEFRGESDRLLLPSAPYYPLFYSSDGSLAAIDKEVAVYLNGLTPLSLKNFKFHASLSNTTLEGIQSMLFQAELLVAYGNIYW
ncbi:MAG: hypothetical protein ACH350_03365 [Parachlamydiaceae bacterium]